jgi:aminoethylphosphonate catabolism LysR family transcriptional regulator
MRLTQLRSFYAVAQTGSFTKAADMLHLSQPTLTTQVRLLEDRYQVELFFRHGRQVVLTEIGEQLLQIAQQMFNLEGDAISLLEDVGELRSGHLRVAAVGPYHVTQMLVEFNRRYPAVRVSVSAGNSENVLEGLLHYRADVGVLAQVVADSRFLSVPFAQHPVVIFVHSQHRFSRRRAIRIAELRGERMILREAGSTTRKALDAALRRAGVEVQVVMEVESREVIREAVAQGIGIAAVSEVEYVPGPGLHAVKISDTQVYTYAHVLCLAERRDTRIVRAFFDSVGA